MLLKQKTSTFIFFVISFVCYGLSMIITHSLNFSFLAYLPVFFIALHLFFLFYIRNKNLKKIAFYGFLSGLFGFGVQSLFIPWTAYNFSQTYGKELIVIFLLVSLMGGIYHAFFSMGLSKVFTFLEPRFKKSNFIFLSIFSGIFLSLSYYYFLQHNSLILIGKNAGYPLFNPLLPFFQIKKNGVEKTIICPACNSKINLVHLNPEFDPNNYENLFSMNEKINKIFNSINLCKTKNGYINLILGPESTFPYDIYKNEKTIKKWKKALNKNSQAMFGVTRNIKNEKYQSVIHFDKKTDNFLDKKVLFPIFEDNKYCSNNSSKCNTIQICPNPTKDCLTFHILICYELFYNIFALKNDCPDADIVIAFVQESWFPAYVKNLMQSYANFASVINNKKLIYVTHTKLCFD